jgi:hypothetical protein
MLLNDAQQQERISSMYLEQTCLLSDFYVFLIPGESKIPSFGGSRLSCLPSLKLIFGPFTPPTSG